MAKNDLRKCPICGKADDMSKMVTHESHKRRYFHVECLEQKLKKDEQKKQENEWQEQETARRLHLHETIAEIYDVQFAEIPVRFYAMIEHLRNGSPVFKGKKFDRRYKEGFGYDVIERTYIECRESIEWANNNKDFISMSQALGYGMRIIVDRIPLVERKMRKEKQAQEVREAQKKNEVINNEKLQYFDEEPTIKPKKKKDNVDISKFL